VYDQAQDPNFFPPIVRPKALAVGPQIQQTFAKAYKAGVKILFGTDTGVSKHGDNAREFRSWSRAACRRWRPSGRDQRAREVPRISTTRTGSIAVASSVSWSACRAIRSRTSSVMERVVFVMKDDTVYKAP
jgi:hypothetical protein